MKTLDKECLFCEQTFKASLKEHNRGNAKYCSRSCFGKHNTQKSKEHLPNLTCAWCGNNFYRCKGKQRNSKSGLFFCTRKCKDSAQRIGGLNEIMPSHYSEVSKEYRIKALNAYPHECNRCGYDEYLEVLQVHHKDHDRSNNHVSNLEILCPTCHVVEHRVDKTCDMYYK